MSSTEQQTSSKPVASSANGKAPKLPTVTVIIPTYNRAGPVADALRSVVAQDYPADRMDVIVVDNSSSDNTEEVVSGITETAPFPVRFYRKENKGPAASRNYGMQRSEADIVAFTDSDCTVATDWVRRGVSNLAEGVGLVAGPVHPIVNPARIPSFFVHQIDHMREDYIYVTANVFYRRDVVTDFGGFDEQFGAYPWGTPVGGEDTDLAWRVKRAGYKAVFDPELSVSHEATAMPLLSWLIDPIRVQVMPLLVKKFPELREKLPARYFLHWRNPLFYAAVAGTVAAAVKRDPRPLAAAIFWIWSMRSMVARDFARPTRWWRIPVKYTLHVERSLLQTAVLAYASARHRSLVL